MHLEIQRPLNCALGIIRRRELKLMQAPGSLKLALLKANANRVRALAFGIDRGWTYAYGLFTWRQSVMHTATALLVWVTFWCGRPLLRATDAVLHRTYVQPWHVPLLCAAAIASVGASKFRADQGAPIALQING